MGAFDKSESPLFFSDLERVNFKTDSGALLLFVLIVITLTAVIQPFQIRLVRMLEGYWSGRLTAFAYRLAVAGHERRRSRLRRQVNAPDSPLDDEEICIKPTSQQILLQREAHRLNVAAARAKDKLQSYPPGDEPVLPTMLGNVLRRSERVSGERYGLQTIYTWPRLYPFLGSKVAAEYDSETDSVDASTNLAVTFMTMSVIGLVAFVDDAWLLSVPVGLLLMALAAYRAAISAGGSLALTMAVGYDLHRFDLIKALHLELPTTPQQEIVRNEVLSRFFVASDTRHAPQRVDKGLAPFSYLHSKPD
ncbi:hypothetical protein ACLQ3A_13100 [Micromonospora zamorensis]|uniref:hypothetical protein n=1 Tax=Micromonospora zamorensis TaxID=709883 RepID=UPI003CF71BC5